MTNDRNQINRLLANNTTSNPVTEKTENSVKFIVYSTLERWPSGFINEYELS